MRRLALLTTVALLTVVGCLGTPGGPAGVDDVSWANESAVDTRALAAAHAATVMDAGSFTFRRNVSTWRADPEIQPRTWTPDQRLVLRFDVSRSRMTKTTAVVGSDHERRSRTYANESTEYARVVQAGRTTFHVSRADFGDRTLPEYANRSAFSSVRRLADWNVSYAGTADRGGRTLLRFVADHGLDHDVFESGTNATATLLVRPDGLVVRVEERFEGTVTAAARDDDSRTNATVVRTTTLEAVGDTTVDPPPWLDEAADQGRID